MSLYCMTCRRNAESKNLKVLRTKKPGRILFLSKCAVCDVKNQNLSKKEKLADY